MPRLGRTTLFLSFALALFAQSASAATTVVNMTGSLTFDPAKVAVTLGSNVDWHNASAFGHTSTSDTRNPNGSDGVAWWNSGTVSANNDFVWAFTAAGSFPYHCNFHSGMVGTVSVKPKAQPTSGAVNQQYTITWSTKDLGSAFRYDVQVQRPGTTGWANWKANTTLLSAPFTPDAGAGVYKFRSRLERTATGGVSNWSPARTITAG